MNDLLMTYYGDDFTGSTDALEALTKGGVPSVLFLKPPTAALLNEHFSDVRAVGLAGMSRALTPQEMDESLPAELASLASFGAPFCHYKVCSTFDSSPEIGSIGRAAEIGRNQFNSTLIPIIVGAPRLRRYMLFGNLFAAMGQTTYRIDRHPTMNRHPVTPMAESDLRCHLAKQTDLPIALIDLSIVNRSTTAIATAVDEALTMGIVLLFFDTLDEEHLAKIGHWLGQAIDQPLFIIGSSGVEDALVACWKKEGIISELPDFPAVAPIDNLMVISGSASPVTEEQIRVAEAAGFSCLRINVDRLIEEETAKAEHDDLCSQSISLLNNAKSVILYSALGPEDKAIIGRARSDHKLAMRQGQIARTLIEETDITRICIAGGDTCSSVVQQLDLFAMRMIAPVAPGAPLCRAYAHTSRWDGLQLVLKGGQIGQPDFFIRLLGET